MEGPELYTYFDRTYLSTPAFNIKILKGGLLKGIDLETMHANKYNLVDLN